MTDIREETESVGRFFVPTRESKAESLQRGPIKGPL